MFQRWFGRDSRNNRAVTDALYERIVAAARQPAFYAQWDVPDTPLGRFEMISLHVFLFLHRVRGEGGAMAEVAQAMTEEFFSDVDSSVLDKDDTEALAAALARNVRPDLVDWPGAGPLARYVRAAADGLRAQPTASFLGAGIEFPQAGGIE